MHTTKSGFLAQFHFKAFCSVGDWSSSLRVAVFMTRFILFLGSPEIQQVFESIVNECFTIFDPTLKKSIKTPLTLVYLIHQLSANSEEGGKTLRYPVYRGHKCSCLIEIINDLRKSYKMVGLPSIQFLFRSKFNKFNNERAQMLDSIIIL